VYVRILGHDLQLYWDDEQYVRANEAVKGFTLEHLKSAFASNYLGNYAPVQIFSYMLDYTVWGMKASGYFLTDITKIAMAQFSGERSFLKQALATVQ
jgi:protein O-mannosyl-transferase